MDILIRKLKNIRDVLKSPSTLVDIMRNDELKELIIKLNTGKPGESLPTSQLWNGIDSEGRRLEDRGGSYSALTIEGLPGVFKGKKELGLPFDRVTLYNEGIFYNTFEVKTEVEGNKAVIRIIADTTRGETNLVDDWGEDIVGLTEENVNIFIKSIRKELVNYLREKFRSA